ncbi:acyltransferase family-domain-containing protein [Xylariaceae sp. AK1471]|nr:acyltransferase family-domain-containing protein [Xylariaceae sp. AK1471]
MTVFQVFEQLRLRKTDSLASYHLLGNESDHLEKGDETETSIFHVEINDLSADENRPQKRIVAFRWLRKLRILLPSFLQPPAAQGELRRLRPTAWLEDGLRGVAAFFVVLHHMSLIWFSWDIHNGWSNSNEPLIRLPIIRLIISGPANVMIFFVISGYALSWKPLSLLRRDQHLKMYQGLASSIFRRHPRLFIPAIFICAPAPIIAYLGGYDGAEGMPGAAITPMNPPRFDTIWEQFSDYTRTLIGLSDVYTPNGSAWIYSDSLWTLPIEFKSSLVVFSMLVALSRCTTRARVVITLCVAIYSLWYFHWGEFLFIGGMLIVDANHHSQQSASARGLTLEEAQGDDEVQRSRPPGPVPLRSIAFRRLCSTAAFLAGLFVFSMPEQGRGAAGSWGFKALVGLIPAHFHTSGAADYFWQPLAAVFLVLVIDSTRSLQRIFTTRLAQYLGRVSFALYLVHMLILHSLGFWLGKYFLEFTGSESYWQYGTGIGMAAVIVGCVIIYAADLGSRLVDVNVVRFTAWAYSKLCRTEIEG